MWETKAPYVQGLQSESQPHTLPMFFIVSTETAKRILYKDMTPFSSIHPHSSFIIIILSHLL